MHIIKKIFFENQTKDNLPHRHIIKKNCLKIKQKITYQQIFFLIKCQMINYIEILFYLLYGIYIKINYENNKIKFVKIKINLK